MADLAQYQRDLQKFENSYAKEAIKEPINFWALAGFAVAAGYSFSVIPLLVALIVEIAYVLLVPNLPWYRQLVQTREKQRLLKAHKDTREKLIKTFTPRQAGPGKLLRSPKQNNHE